MAMKLRRETETVLWVHLVPAERDSERSAQTWVMYLQLLEDGLELRLTDFVHLWSKSYAASIAGDSHQDLHELNEALASGAGVQVELESTGSITVLWCGSSHATLASAGHVSVQDLQPLVVHAVESMHTSRLALCSEQQPSALERKTEQGKLAAESTTVKTGPVPKARRPPGQSIVNPLNKRRKAAGGVQFSDQ